MDKDSTFNTVTCRGSYLDLELSFDADTAINYLCTGTCCLYDAVRNGFEAGKIHYEGHWKGWALEIETFLCPDMATSEASAIWAQKSRSHDVRSRNRMI